uniref:Arginine and glutamate-rich protein 1 n=1 Tax=Fagus sylvatica TaxID=28930 RepID=A0A2N9IJU4_FAGSY
MSFALNNQFVKLDDEKIPVLGAEGCGVVEARGKGLGSGEGKGWGAAEARGKRLGSGRGRGWGAAEARGRGLRSGGACLGRHLTTEGDTPRRPQCLTTTATVEEAEGIEAQLKAVAVLPIPIPTPGEEVVLIPHVAEEAAHHHTGAGIGLQHLSDTGDKEVGVLLCLLCPSLVVQQHEAELKLLEEETARRLEDAIRKNVEERLNSEEVRLEIERQIEEGRKKLFDDVATQLEKEKEAALVEARRKEEQARREREELDKMLEENKRRVEESQRREALELQRKEEERYRELELIQRQKEEAARRKRLEEEEERINQMKLLGKNKPKPKSFGTSL